MRHGISPKSSTPNNPSTRSHVGVLRGPALARTVIVALLMLGLSASAQAASDCAACEAAGGVWLTSDLGNVCMKPLKPKEGPILTKIPEEEPEFELEPGHFSGTPGLEAGPAGPAPVVNGHEMTIHDAFLISEPGQHDVRNAQGGSLHSFSLGDNQLAFGALADWNGHTDLVLITLLEAELSLKPREMLLNPIDGDNDGHVGSAVVGSALNDHSFFASFTATIIPSPPAAVIGLAMLGGTGLMRRSKRGAR